MLLHPIQLFSVAVICISVGSSADEGKQAGDTGKLAIKVAFQQIKPQKSRPRLTKEQIKIVSDYADTLERQAKAGRIMMKHHRKTIKMYRSFRYHTVSGKLQTIHNHTRTADRLYSRVEAKVKMIRKKKNITSSQVKMLNSLLKQIQKLENKIDYELNRIRMTPKQQLNRYKFNYGRPV